MRASQKFIYLFSARKNGTKLYQLCISHFSYLLLQFSCTACIRYGTSAVIFKVVSVYLKSICTKRWNDLGRLGVFLLQNTRSTDVCSSFWKTLPCRLLKLPQSVEMQHPFAFRSSKWHALLLSTYWKLLILHLKDPFRCRTPTSALYSFIQLCLFTNTLSTSSRVQSDFHSVWYSVSKLLQLTRPISVTRAVKMSSELDCMHYGLHYYFNQTFIFTVMHSTFGSKNTKIETRQMVNIYMTCSDINYN